MPTVIITLLSSILGPQWIFKVGAIAAALVALVIGYGIWHHKVYMEGYNAYKALIIANDTKTIKDALDARSVRNDCVTRGLRWDVTTGKCSGG